MQYFYKKLGKVVEVEQMFDSHWNYFNAEDNPKVIYQGLIDDFTPVVNPTPVLPDDWGKPTENLDQVVEEIKTPTPGFVKHINLNAETSPAVIALHLPGIGKTWAKKICDRKPKSGGYIDFDSFRKINADLHLDEAGWEKIKELVEF